MRLEDGSTARRAGDAEPHRLAGRRQQFLHQPVRFVAVVGAFTLDQRDSARESGTVAGADAIGELGDRSG